MVVVPCMVSAEQTCRLSSRPLRDAAMGAMELAS